MEVTNILKLQFNELFYVEGITTPLGLGRSITGVLSLDNGEDIIIPIEGSEPLVIAPQKVGNKYEAFGLEDSSGVEENAFDTISIIMRGPSRKEVTSSLISNVKGAIDIFGSATLELLHIEVSTQYDLIPNVTTEEEIQDALS